jgi:hypothetical protein
MGLVAAGQMAACGAILGRTGHPIKIEGAAVGGPGADAICDAGDAGVKWHGLSFRRRLGEVYQMLLALTTDSRRGAEGYGNCSTV